MKKKSLIILPISIVFIVFLFSFISCKAAQVDKNEIMDEEEMKEEEIIIDNGKEENERKIDFADAVKTPHWVSSIPAANTILPGVPVNVIINFNFDLYEGSSITIEKDGIQYSAGDATIDENGLTLRVDMDPQAPGGLYKVSYTACWPDGSCHDGSFEFGIDGMLSGDYMDLRDSKEITINMEDIAFDKPKIIIKKGTTVTWINKDDVGHTVNSDPHPGHNYFPEQNSRILSKGEAFSLTFELPGFYPYHCSPHYSTMKGSILVE